MRKMLAWTFAAGLAAASAVSAAGAMPAAQPPQNDGGPGIIKVYGGCGIYRHRNAWGRCVPGGQAGVRWGWGWRRCPPGFHPGYRRCWPNR